MTSLDGLHRTTMFTETVNDIECDEKKALRKTLSEEQDKNKELRSRIVELENALAVANELIEILKRKPKYVTVDKNENVYCPPFGK